MRIAPLQLDPVVGDVQGNLARIVVFEDLHNPTDEVLREPFLGFADQDEVLLLRRLLALDGVFGGSFANLVKDSGRQTDIHAVFLEDFLYEFDVYLGHRPLTETKPTRLGSRSYSQRPRPRAGAASLLIPIPHPPSPIPPPLSPFASPSPIPYPLLSIPCLPLLSAP